MGWDGSGNFNRKDGTRTGTQVWQDAANAGVKILSADHDTHDQDIADGLENTVALDGQTTTTTDNAILRYDSGTSKFAGVDVDASRIVGREATGDTKALTAFQAGKILGSFLKGHIEGLEADTGTDADHDLDIQTGACSMVDGSGNIGLFTLDSVLTKQIDANWAEGDSAGGFPSGLTLSSDTKYDVFVIGKDDGTVDAGFDTDPAAANLLSDASGYSWYRRITSRYTDGSSNILAMFQEGDWNYYSNAIVEINDTGGSVGVFQTGTVSVPPNQLGIFSIFVNAASTDDARGFLTGFEGNDDSGTHDQVVYFNAPAIGTGDVVQVGARTMVVVDSSSQVQYTMSTGGSWNAVVIGTFGWKDDRGRNS